MIREYLLLGYYLSWIQELFSFHHDCLISLQRLALPPPIDESIPEI